MKGSFTLKSNMYFHHHGLAVKNPDRSRKALEYLGYHLGEIVYDPIQKVYVQLADKANTPRIELVWAGDEASPIDRWIKSQNQSLYHTCYEVDDLSTCVEELRDLGKVMPLGPAVPAVLFDQRLIQFLYVEGLGLIELLQR